GQGLYSRKQDRFRIAEQLLVVLKLVDLIGEGLDLLHLIVDHLDVLRDFLRCVQDGLRMESWIVNDPLRASRYRDADCHKRDCDELFHGVLSLRSIGFSGDTPPITGDDLPRQKGAKMYVIHKMQRSPWKRKGNGHEDDRQSPRAGLPTARFAIFVIVSKEDTNGYASIFQRPQKLLRSVTRHVGSHSAWTSHERNACYSVRNSSAQKSDADSPRRWNGSLMKANFERVSCSGAWTTSSQAECESNQR